MKLAAKLTLLLLACAVVPLIGVAALSFVSAKAALSVQIGASLETALQEETHRLDQFFSDALVDLATWSRLAIMQDVLTDDEEGELAAELGRLGAQYPQFAELTILNADGQAVASTADGRKGADLTDTEIQRAARRREPYQGTVERSPLTGLTALTLARPISADYDAETVIGTLIGVIDWKHVQGELLGHGALAGAAQDADHRLVLTSRQDVVLYDTLSSEVAPRRSALAGLPSEEGVGEHEVDGRRYLVGTTRSRGHGTFADPGWTLQGLVSAETAYTSVRQLRDRSFALALAVVVVVAAIGYLGTRRITHPIRRVARRLRDIAEGDGDLTVRLEGTGRDETAELALAFNTFVGKVSGTIHKVAGAADGLGAAAAHLSRTAQESNRTLGAQQTDTERVAAAVEQMSATVQEAARNARQAVKSTEEANDQALRGREAVTQNMTAIEALSAEVKRAAEVIQRLESESEGIGTILEVIRGIADQTNLLALNAAIEAARAGEQGRGFAVVADEVRILAQRTQESTQEIQDLIGRLQNEAKLAVDVMVAGRSQAEVSVLRAEAVRTSLAAVSEGISSIAGRNTEMADACEQQATVTNEISESIAAINTMGETTAKGTTQTESTAADVHQQVAALQALVAEFKIESYEAT
ncbi:MAG: methyl-accepting chemotaxis protein [Gammaproteobacteria bacterium]|nr:methyl-accepting chemotaxis protein [Gammaproteobacteria bacterium]